MGTSSSDRILRLANRQIFVRPRNKIGLDVALEALRACLREKRATVRQIDHYAKICRVSRVIRPYLEAI